MKKILFIKANPIDTADLRLENEENSIREVLERCEHRNNFVFETRGAVTTKALLNYLLSLSPNILHISGHGSSDEKLFIEGEDGYKEEISIAKLSNLLANFLNHIECLFLNSCHSLAHIEEISDDIPYVIGMREEIPNDTAILFSTSFYNALFNGKSIKDSFKVALDMISLRDFDDELIPRFLDNSDKIPPEGPVTTGPEVVSSGGIEEKLVSQEEIDLVQKQRADKVRFYKRLIVVCVVVAIGISVGTYFISKETLTALGGLLPSGLIALPFKEIEKNKKRIELLTLFKLKRKRFLRALASITDGDIDNLNDEFERIITI
ncbi:hypothetical protein C5O00_14025 [Pukyongia salina]|uniref:CHAT domain-containing protein n=1 Tax=Pukyongia salina TaxID=2094025 RepID=A0A2S0I0S7_9FLAO|nr:CHAT domain-containing protein [Pukyongia salina]AVI52213.1 hypothetical protein C5O00_14025 [Pukyongia salina]